METMPKRKMQRILAKIRGTAKLIQLSSDTDTFKIYCLIGVPDPEVVAMLQALYSRSPKSIIERIGVLTPKGAAKFMEQFYAGYGHNSIADCGSVILFFEGVPMQVAKQLQRDPRYNGQEASTRYMDFSDAVAINSHNLQEGARIQARWLDFYHHAQEPLKEHLRQQFPSHQDENPKAYERAINARCFDVLRGLLPVGMPTNVSWSTSLRLAKDHLTLLSQSPDLDTRLVATSALNGLVERFPGTFKKGARPEKLEWLKKRLARQDVATRYREALFGELLPADQLFLNGLETVNIPSSERPLFLERPLFTELDLDTNFWGRIFAEFLIDYGSFRDLQRHRALDIPVPVLDVDLGIHPWYLDQLPPELRKQALRLIAEQTEAIRALSDDRYVRQPYIPMGFRVPALVGGPLHGWVYMIELRSRTDVHPTLREVVRRIGRRLRFQLKDQLVIHVNEDTDDFSRRRANATFFDKKTGKAIE